MSVSLVLPTNDPENGFVIQKIDDTIGKGIFATKAYAAGETVFRERPLVSCQFPWNGEYGYKACHMCLEPLETAQENVVRLANNQNILLPHTECCTTRNGFHSSCPDCGIGYCSITCQNLAYSAFHKTLCPGERPGAEDHPLQVLKAIWTNFHYPPESTSIMLLCRIFATIIQAQDPEATLANYLTFMHNAVNEKEELTHKLLGDQFAGVLEQLRHAASVAFPQPAVQQLLTPEGFITLFALIGRNGQGIATSPYSQYVRKLDRLRLASDERQAMDKLVEKIYADMEDNVGQFLDNEGSGLYYLQSHLNHSCVPNAVVEFPFNNHELVINTTRKIGPGEEIFISYLEEGEEDTRSRHSRQKHLRENYLFTCQCKKCVSQVGDPDVTSDEEMPGDDSDEEGPCPKHGAAGPKPGGPSGN